MVGTAPAVELSHVLSLCESGRGRRSGGRDGSQRGRAFELHRDCRGGFRGRAGHIKHKRLRLGRGGGRRSASSSSSSSRNFVLSGRRRVRFQTFVGPVRITLIDWYLPTTAHHVRIQSSSTPHNATHSTKQLTHV